MSKRIILFLAANPLGTTELALAREARAIQDELERSGQRDSFEFVTRWAVHPLDLLRELRKPSRRPCTSADTAEAVDADRALGRVETS